jgi:hypothetical protein
MKEQLLRRSGLLFQHMLLTRILSGVAVHDRGFEKFKNIDQLFPGGTKCFVRPLFYEQSAVVTKTINSSIAQIKIGLGD